MVMPFMEMVLPVAGMSKKTPFVRAARGERAHTLSPSPAVLDGNLGIRKNWCEHWRGHFDAFGIWRRSRRSVLIDVGRRRQLLQHVEPALVKHL